MKISFERRFSSEIAFEVEIDDKHKNDSVRTQRGAAIIYIKSDPKLEKIPNFYANNTDALADMKRLADLEKAAA